jgi:hypothetical protein
METPISGGSMGQRKQHKSFSAEIQASGMLLGKCLGASMVSKTT